VARKILLRGAIEVIEYYLVALDRCASVSMAFFRHQKLEL
jgi:hypothetical protein